MRFEPAFKVWRCGWFVELECIGICIRFPCAYRRRKESTSCIHRVGARATITVDWICKNESYESPYLLWVSSFLLGHWAAKCGKVSA
jgi:hypothetical protein